MPFDAKRLSARFQVSIFPKTEVTMTSRRKNGFLQGQKHPKTDVCSKNCRKITVTRIQNLFTLLCGDKMFTC